MKKTFKEGDLVLQIAINNRINVMQSKLAPKWKGTYRVLEIIAGGAYRLETIHEDEIPNTWNTVSLKQYLAYNCIHDIRSNVARKPLSI